MFTCQTAVNLGKKPNFRIFKLQNSLPGFHPDSQKNSPDSPSSNQSGKKSGRLTRIKSEMTTMNANDRIGFVIFAACKIGSNTIIIK